MNRFSFLLVAQFSVLVPSLTFAQTGGFVATLGNDTIQVERFTKSPTRIEGVVVTRSPATRVARYSLTLGSAGAPLRYEVTVQLANGTPLRGPGLGGTMTFSGDTITRTMSAAAGDTTTTIVAVGRVFPNLAGSYLMYELGVAHARRSAAQGAGEGTFGSLTLFPTQQRASASRTWFPAADSAEVDYFGVARSGYKFSQSGELLRADWSGTTMKYRIVRVAAPNVEAIATRWAGLDARGAGLAAVSPRDTMRATVGAASVVVDYSRPSKRGRNIWGNIVPFNEVWRLGANFATHFETSRDLLIGGTRVPAGRYTLWMLPSERGESQLIINSRVNIFGTQYNGTGDFARIPLEPLSGQPVTEQLTIEVRDGRIWVKWDDRSWSATIAAAAALPQRTIGG